MGAPTTVNKANESARVSLQNCMAGPTTLIRDGFPKGCMVIQEITITIPVEDSVVATLAGSSGGVTLPTRHVVRDFIGIATTPVSTAAQLAALANDAARDNAVILSDTDAPIGSTYRGLTHASGAVSGCAMYRKSAADTWTAL